MFFFLDITKSKDQRVTNSNELSKPIFDNFFNRLKDFLAKKVETEKEKLEIKRKKLQQLKEGSKHTFEDKSYFEQREKRERDIYDSLDRGL